MAGLFFLSIREPWAGKIRTGEKVWELRENPRFGIFPEAQLAPGDRIFIVAGPKENSGMEPRISCMAEVPRILRGADFPAYFGDPATGHFREAGFGPEEWETFERKVLPRYRTAVGLRAHPLRPAIPVSVIRHRHTGRPWSGRGCLPASHLKRYAVEGLSVEGWGQALGDRVAGPPRAAEGKVTSLI